MEGSPCLRAGHNIKPGNSLTISLQITPQQFFFRLSDFVKGYCAAYGPIANPGHWMTGLFCFNQNCRVHLHIHSGRDRNKETNNLARQVTQMANPRYINLFAYSIKKKVQG